MEKEQNSLEVNPTLEKLFPEFLAHKKATTWSAATEKKNLSIWKKYYSTNEIIKVPLDDLKVKVLREWAYDLIKRHDLTQKEYLNVATWMKQMLEFAEEEELIEKNFYPLLKITNKNVYRQIEEKPDENKVLTTEQELDLYRLCWKYYENNHFPVHSLVSLAIIMLFQLGLRPCEVCTLRYSDIEGDEIVVKRYYSEKGNTVMENRTKAGHGFRRILLTSLALDIIQETRKHHYENDNWISDYIFMTGENFKSFYDRMRKAFPAMCETIGAPRNTPYSGRRTFISSLVDANVNIKTIRNYVGHKDAKTTLNNYCFDRNGKEAKKEQLETARSPFSLDEIVAEIGQKTVPKTYEFVPKLAQ